jgi:glutathione S-transferase
VSGTDKPCGRPPKDKKVTEPVLYSFRRCPYAMRARLALLASGTVCEIREVKLSAKPAEMLGASPKGTVPVLVLPDGQVIDESIEIMRWALGQNDPERWLERDDAALIAANDGPFKHHLDRYKYPERHQTAAKQHQEAAKAMLDALEARLHDGTYLCGDAPGITDMALFPFIRQFAEVDRAWFDALRLPRVQSWLAKHLASAEFASVMVRLPPWQAGDAPVAFPALIG